MALVPFLANFLIWCPVGSAGAAAVGRGMFGESSPIRQTTGRFKQGAEGIQKRYF